MTTIAMLALALTAAALVTHASTAAIAWAACRPRRGRSTSGERPPVTIVRPVHGLDDADRVALASAFRIDYPEWELIICAEHADDPAVAWVRALAAEHPDVACRLLIGRTVRTVNPKLDNIEKGWRAARHPWVIISDCNVLLPPDYIDAMLASWQSDTGLVSAPPIAAYPANFWAEVECAFLNTYQARWQYAAAAAGHGFAHGKNLLWRRADLDAAGGILALAGEIAEDAAATKLVRAGGRHVELARPPFAQPLGRRGARVVLARQLRWAQLRRQSFPLQFVPEVLSTSLVPVAAGAIAAHAAGFCPATTAACVLAFWIGIEAALARALGWHFGWWSPLAAVVRDLLLVPVWIAGWVQRGYEWHGARVSTARRPAPRLVADQGRGR